MSKSNFPLFWCGDTRCDGPLCPDCGVRSERRRAYLADLARKPSGRPKDGRDKGTRELERKLEGHA